jgi:uncharacterized membrane protein YedE/YeeE
MLDFIGEANAVALIGLVGGVVLGLAARLGRFCTLGAVEDWLYSSDDRRIRMWGVALATAVITTHLAMATGHFDPTQSAYLDQSWVPAASVIGGLLFGYGMAISGNCGYGALARLGGGDLRAFVIVIVMGLSAYFVMSGPLARLRVTLFPVETGSGIPQGFGPLLTQATGVPTAAIGIIVGLLILAVSISSAPMRSSPKHIFWGVIVGMAVVSGWIGTYWVATTGFAVEPIETHSFAAPIGDTMLYAMTASGNSLSFSVGSVVGVLIGAALGSYGKGHFRWEACEDPRELRRQISGAALMGTGAVLAAGCSIGQGVAAFSLLAFSAPVTLAAIIAGAAIGLRQMILGAAAFD